MLARKPSMRPVTIVSITVSTLATLLSQVGGAVEVLLGDASWAEVALTGSNGLRRSKRAIIPRVHEPYLTSLISIQTGA
jgi:hypothetical protein